MKFQAYKDENGWVHLREMGSGFSTKPDGRRHDDGEPMEYLGAVEVGRSDVVGALRQLTADLITHQAGLPADYLEWLERTYLIPHDEPIARD